MKKELLITIAILTTGAVHGAIPQRTDSITLTLQQAREKALQTNKEMEKSGLMSEQRHHDAKAYRSNFYPRVSLLATDLYSTASGSMTIQGGHLPIYLLNPTTGTYVPNVTVGADGGYTLNEYADFPSQSLKYKVKNVFVGGIMLQQPLYMGGKISAAYEMAQIAENMAATNQQLTKAQTILDTDEAYCSAIQAKELTQVAYAYLQLVDELHKNVSAAIRHGLKTRNDLLKVEVKRNEALLNIQRAENGYRLASMNLCHQTGLPLDTPLNLLAPDQEPTQTKINLQSADVTSQSINSRPETEILQQRTELANQQVKLTRSDYLPQVALVGGYNYTNGGELAGKKFLDNGSAHVGLTLKVPLLNFGESSNKLRSVRAQQQMAQLELDDKKEMMQLELQQARNNLQEAITESQLTQTALQQAAENVKQSRQQYDVGMEPISQLLEAQALWQQAAANDVVARCKIITAHTRWLKAAGKL